MERAPNRLSLETAAQAGADCTASCKSKLRHYPSLRDRCELLPARALRLRREIKPWQSSSPLPNFSRITGTDFGSPTTERHQRSRPARRSAMPNSEYSRKHAVMCLRLAAECETWPQVLPRWSCGRECCAWPTCGRIWRISRPARARPTTRKPTRIRIRRGRGRMAVGIMILSEKSATFRDHASVLNGRMMLSEKSLQLFGIMLRY